MPLTSTRMVDYTQMRQLIEQLRVNVPSSIMESERMLRERDRILADAEAEAAHRMEEVNRRAHEILANDSLVQSARQEATRILANAQDVANERRDEADRYAARVLEELAEKLRIISRQVDNGLELLRRNLDLEETPDADAEHTI